MRNSGRLSISRTLVSGNTTGPDGGGIADRGTLALIDTVFLNNSPNNVNYH
jgi:hypothetical protein